MTRKIEYLDGIRGVASVIVILSHIAISFWPATLFGTPSNHPIDKWLYGAPIRFFIEGNFAVCLFFIISGFVLTYRYQSKEDMPRMKSLCIRRYPRLMPPVFLSIMIAWALMITGGMWNAQAGLLSGSEWMKDLYSSPPDFLEAVRHGTIGSFINGSTKYNKVLWTMKIEFIDSFLVILFCILATKTNRMWMRVALAVIFFLVLSTQLGITGLSYFALFIVGYIFGRKPLIIGKYMIPVAWAALLAGLYLGGASGGENYSELNKLNIFGISEWDYIVLCHSVGAALVFYAISTIPVLQQFFASNICRFLGKISFSIYLLHLSIICSVGSFLMVKYYDANNYNMLASVCSLIIICTSIFLSILFTTYVDQRAINWAARFGRKRLNTKITPEEAQFASGR